MADRMTQTHKGPVLAALLRQRQEAIASAWARRVHGLSGTRYQAYSLEEITAWASGWVVAAAETLASGHYQATEAHLWDVSLARLRMGFDISEVLEALMLFGEGVLPAIRQTFPPGSAEREGAVDDLDAYLRFLVGRFGHLYAEAMTEDLYQQQQRTALVLEAVETVNSSLDLSQVLQWIVEQSAAIFHLGCTLCLLDADQGLLVPQAWAGYPGDAKPPGFAGAVGWPSSDALLLELLDGNLPIACQDAGADPRFGPELVRALSLKSTLALPITAGDELLGALICTTLDNHGDFAAEDVELLSGLVHAAGLAVQNAQRYGATRRRLAEVESLQRVTTALLQELPLEEILSIVCAEAQQLIRAAGSAVLLLEDSVWLRVAGSTGVPVSVLDRLPLESSLAGLAIRRGSPVLINDLGSLPQALRVTSHLEALLAVPLSVGDTVIGALDLVNKPGGFTPDDMQIMGLFADGAALAIESARLQRQAEQLAVMEERQRLGRELHDSVTQALYSVTLYAEATRLALAGDRVDVALENLGELHNMAREAMLDMRMLIFDLHPPILKEEGLAAALRARLAAVESRAGLQTRIHAQGEGRLPLALEEELFWIALEAFNNVVKHAQAGQVTVHLRWDEQQVCLKIIDDGVGFDLDPALEGGGMGLRGIGERVARIAGDLDIKTSPGQGTALRVEATVPLRRTLEALDDDSARRIP